MEQGHRSSRWEGGEGVVISMDYSASGDRWAWDYFSPPNEGKDDTWYISGIFPANWVIIMGVRSW